VECTQAFGSLLIVAKQIFFNVSRLFSRRVKCRVEKRLQSSRVDACPHLDTTYTHTHFIYSRPIRKSLSLSIFSISASLSLSSRSLCDSSPRMIDDI
jgi:hypothetical protein